MIAVPLLRFGDNINSEHLALQAYYYISQKLKEHTVVGINFTGVIISEEFIRILFGKLYAELGIYFEERTYFISATKYFICILDAIKVRA